MFKVKEIFITARVRSTRESNVFTLFVSPQRSLLTGNWSLVPGPFLGRGGEG